MNTAALFDVDGMLNFVACLPDFKHQQRGSFRFPLTNEWRGVSLFCNEWNARNYFVGLIDSAVAAGFESPDRAVEGCQLCDGVAFFLDLEWRDGRILRCSMQVIAAVLGDLKNLYMDTNENAAYYRFDYSIEERGQLFDHPFPHIHSVAEGAPRFHFPMRPTAFPPFVFLEFVMINHAHGHWLNWLIREYGYRLPDDAALERDPPGDFIEAFKDETEWSVITLARRKRFIRRMRNAAHDAVDAASEDLPAIDKDLLDLNYW